MIFDENEDAGRKTLEPGVHDGEIVSATEKFREDWGANVLELTVKVDGSTVIQSVNLDERLWLAKLVFKAAGFVPAGEVSAEVLVGRPVTVETYNTEAGYPRISKWIEAGKLVPPPKAAPAAAQATGGGDIPF